MIQVKIYVGFPNKTWDVEIVNFYVDLSKELAVKRAIEIVNHRFRAVDVAFVGLYTITSEFEPEVA